MLLIEWQICHSDLIKTNSDAMSLAVDHWKISKPTSAPVAITSVASDITPRVWKEYTHSSRLQTAGWGRKTDTEKKNTKHIKQKLKNVDSYHQLSPRATGSKGGTFNIGPFWKTWRSSQITQCSLSVSILCSVYFMSCGQKQKSFLKFREKCVDKLTKNTYILTFILSMHNLTNNKPGVNTLS